MDFRVTLQRYYWLSKPGIVYANVITAIAGYLLASKLHIHWTTMAGLIVGLALVIMGACAYNNYLDRGIDARMKRTSKRGLVTGAIAGWQALTYATIVSIGGLLLLAMTQNWLTTSLAAVALFDYVVLYGIGKRKSVHGTLVGCISGAIPLMAGYTAVVGRLDLGAWLLFIVMVAWQMAHFYGIALYRLKDYQAANIPVMPAVYGPASTKIQTLFYIAAFMLASLTLSIFGYIGFIAGTVLVLLGLAWFIKSVTSYAALAPDLWGKKVFLFSLLVMLGMSLMLAIGPELA